MEGGTPNIICAPTCIWLALYSLPLSFTSMAIGEYEARIYTAASFVLTRVMWDGLGP